MKSLFFFFIQFLPLLIKKEINQSMIFNIVDERKKKYTR